MGKPNKIGLGLRDSSLHLDVPENITTYQLLILYLCNYLHPDFRRALEVVYSII